MLGADDRAGVVGGLEQTRNQLWLERADLGRLGLQPDVDLEPVRQHVVVRLPPAPLAGVAGDLDERVHLVALHAVQLKEPTGDRRHDGHLGVLDAADRRLRDAHLLGGLVGGHAGLFTEATQRSGQASTSDGRASSHAGQCGGTGRASQ